jgi:8-amino-7-oxononanoate synthase
MLAFCSNDYLGLAAHPRVVAALREGAAIYGAGSGASHLISGHSRAHALLEERLAAFRRRRTWSMRVRCTSAPATWPTWHADRAGQRSGRR